MLKTNPRWRTAAIWEVENRPYISATVCPMGTKWHGGVHWASELVQKLKFPTGGWSLSWKSENRPYLYYNLTDRHEIWHSDAYCHLSSITIWNFKNSWWHTATIWMLLKSISPRQRLTDHRENGMMATLAKWIFLCKTGMFIRQFLCVNFAYADSYKRNAINKIIVNSCINIRTVWAAVW